MDWSEKPLEDRLRSLKHHLYQVRYGLTKVCEDLEAGPLWRDVDYALSCIIDAQDAIELAREQNTAELELIEEEEEGPSDREVHLQEVGAAPRNRRTFDEDRSDPYDFISEEQAEGFR